MSEEQTLPPPKEIFISHSSKDKEIVDAFVDLLTSALHVSPNNIYCTSIDGTKIESGENVLVSIKDNILGAKIIILLISSNYSESEMCMNEMGAAWMSKAKVIPLIIEPINYKTVGVIQEPNQIEKLSKETNLDRLKDIIQRNLKIESKDIKSDRWTTKRGEFLSKVNEYVKKNTFIPMKRDNFKQLQQSEMDLKKKCAEFEKKNKELENMINKLEKVEDLEKRKEIIRDNLGSKEKFEKLIDECNSALGKFNSVVTEAFYKYYKGGEYLIYKLGEDDYNEEIKDAFDRNILIEKDSDNWFVINEDNIKIKKAKTSLDKLKDFIEELNDNSFIEYYEDEYEDKMNFYSKEFWERHFSLR